VSVSPHICVIFMYNLIMRNWRSFFLVAVVMGVAVAGFDRIQTYKQSKMIKAAMSSGEAVKNSLGILQNCNAKKYCITVYVAPWCPACKASQATFQALHKYLPSHRPEVGFGVIIGAGKAIENEEEQKVLSPIESFADNNGAILKSRKIDVFPTWIINDQNGKEIFRQAGGFQISDENQVVMLMQQFFKI
jgi:thiol-disulfide isomerase/thioredoxin